MGEGRDRRLRGLATAQTSRFSPMFFGIGALSLPKALSSCLRAGSPAGSAAAPRLRRLLCPQYEKRRAPSFAKLRRELPILFQVVLLRQAALPVTGMRMLLSTRSAVAAEKRSPVGLQRFAHVVKRLPAFAGAPCSERTSIEKSSCRGPRRSWSQVACLRSV